jgi:hypothetical protein
MKKKSIYKQRGISIEDFKVEEAFNDNGISFKTLIKEQLKPIMKDFLQKKDNG